MRNKYSWRDLVGEPPLCEGGRLCSIVFCCDPRRVSCSVFNDALEMLGISKSEFIRVMDEGKIPVEEKDGTCFGSLAFCPSPEKESRDRNAALMKLGWSLTSYLKFKFDLLKRLVPPSKLDYAFNTRVLKQYALDILDLESKKVYKAFALGDVRRTLIVTEVFSENDLKDKGVESLLSQTEYVGVRIPKSLISELDDLVEKGVVGSRSDGIRRALTLYLKAVKQGAEVKR